MAEVAGSRGGDVDEQRARSFVQAERVRVRELLQAADVSGRSDREAGGAHDGSSDAAEVLESQNTDDALTAGLRDRLAALERAEARLDAGSYGRSIRSGQPIPDERLEADPAAELTVEEAEQSEDHPR
jgi:RNA polymerase-binding transcription factor